MVSHRGRRALRWSLGILAIVGAACGGPEPEVATLRFILYELNDTVLVDIRTHAVTGGPITISHSAFFRAEFLKADGTLESFVQAGPFHLDIATGNFDTVRVAYGPPLHEGRLNKVAPGMTYLDFGLFHIPEHTEWVRRVPIVVN